MRFLLIFLAIPAFAATCDGLKSLAIPNTTVVSTQTSAEVCKATFVAKPTADSEIKIEVWMPPASKWNGNFVGVGNESYSGDLKTADMELALQKGYAVAGTDTGHSGSDLKSFASHPEKVIDWSYRSVHVMTDTAKLALRMFYGRFPTRSYFYGCGTGGDQGLSEAQRYPTDYDGIIAGAAGESRVRTNVGLLWNWKSTHDNGGFPAAKLKMVSERAASVCDPDRKSVV